MWEKKTVVIPGSGMQESNSLFFFSPLSIKSLPLEQWQMKMKKSFSLQDIDKNSALSFKKVLKARR